MSQEMDGLTRSFKLFSPRATSPLHRATHYPPGIYQSCSDSGDVQKYSIVTGRITIDVIVREFFCICKPKRNISFASTHEMLYLLMKPTGL